MTKTKEKATTSYGIYLGAAPESVRELRGTINDILGAPHVDNKTKIAALKALSSACSVTGNSISNCHVGS